MTPEELEQLIQDCPTLFHMAERGSWESIKYHGLLSTGALTDLYKVSDDYREVLLASHRPESVAIECEGLPGAVIRDQKPMSDAGLLRALPAELRPADWYRILNSKVFFWLSENRLHRLTNAAAYREQEHDVLEVDTKSIVEAYRDSIFLCPYNSGCTKPFPFARDKGIFSRIDDYPYEHWRARRIRMERVVELVVEHSVPDIADHVKRVVVKRGDQTIAVIEE